MVAVKWFYSSHTVVRHTTEHI